MDKAASIQYIVMEKYPSRSNEDGIRDALKVSLDTDQYVMLHIGNGEYIEVDARQAIDVIESSGRHGVLPNELANAALGKRG